MQKLYARCKNPRQSVLVNTRDPVMPCTPDAEYYQSCTLCLVVTIGLLANLTCIQAELYQMQEAMSMGVNPLWVVPYTNLSADYQELLDDFVTYAKVSRPCIAARAFNQRRQEQKQ